ncbi:hypothetical protein CCB80_08890 [Armatimonadetes bacterium Uphvl-Ar1]|nr:hypothetical protein CCB80_08890 [Armatimonadetes bacterium Uphvl-Ar1]
MTARISLGCSNKSVQRFPRWLARLGSCELADHFAEEERLLGPLASGDSAKRLAQEALKNGPSPVGDLPKPDGNCATPA